MSTVEQRAAHRETQEFNDKRSQRGEMCGWRCEFVMRSGGGRLNFRCSHRSDKLHCHHVDGIEDYFNEKVEKLRMYCPMHQAIVHMQVMHCLRCGAPRVSVGEGDTLYRKCHAEVPYHAEKWFDKVMRLVRSRLPSLCPACRAADAKVAAAAKTPPEEEADEDDAPPISISEWKKAQQAKKELSVSEALEQARARIAAGEDAALQRANATAAALERARAAAAALQREWTDPPPLTPPPG